MRVTDNLSNSSTTLLFYWIPVVFAPQNVGDGILLCFLTGQLFGPVYPISCGGTCTFIAIFGIVSRLFFIWPHGISFPWIPSLGKNVAAHIGIDVNSLCIRAPRSSQINLFGIGICYQLTINQHKTKCLPWRSCRSCNVRTCQTFNSTILKDYRRLPK